MQVISDSQSLANFSAELRKRPFFAVDTEFMREKTYWPILCLIQAASDGLEAIIDPLAENLDLTPFLEALTDPSVVKVFHAARQDMEIFYNLIGAPPKPIFDSQIAAMACGYGDQIGYEPLMRSLLNVRIDKGSRFTDWSRRPLTDAQLDYALSDVTHLREAYVLLKDKLASEDRLSWVEQEMDSLLDPDLYLVKPEFAWKRMKLRSVRPRDIGPVMKIAEWREQEAQTRDAPRGRILKDEAIFEIAHLRPKIPADLAKARSVSSGFERSKSGAGLLEAVAKGIALPKEMLPDIDQNQQREPAPADVVDLLKVLLKRQCEKYSVAPKLIASANDIEKIALSDTADVRALKGWRKDIYGDLALKLKHGKIALKLHGDRVEILETD